VAEPDRVPPPPSGAAPLGAAELAALRAKLEEQQRLIRAQLSALRDTNRRVGREVAACRRTGDILRFRAVPPVGPPPARAEPVSQVAEAEALLRRVLAPGPLRTVEVVRQARLAGISPRTLARARTRLGVLASRVGGAADRGVWYCRLPETPAG
jgi:hypothetical protein